ncbi:hypothetical protein SK128_001281 [Halocaridina rubra]|uniref:Uncharacterized protein n=1 Tax=Halocaridina rubra TaxID=373956 RepID=A0AAN8WMC1_HALRR
MKIEHLELEESQLDCFISENLAECEIGKEKVLTDIRSKVKEVQNEIANSGQCEIQLEDVNNLKGAVTFLKKAGIPKLMSYALLSKKSLKGKCNNDDALPKERAVYLFASHESIKPLILNFRSRYPAWKDAKSLLQAKTQKNNNKEKVKTEDQGLKNKKKIGKKSLKRRNDTENDVDNTENCSFPRKKKKVKETLYINGLLNNEISPQSKARDKIISKPLQNGKSKKGNKKLDHKKKLILTSSIPPSGAANDENSPIPKKKKKPKESVRLNNSLNDKSAPTTLNASNLIESKTVMESEEKLLDNSVSPSDNALESPEKNQDGGFERGRNFRGRGGRRGNRRFSDRRQGNRWGGNGSWRNKRQAGPMRFFDKNSPNSIVVSDDWKNKVAKECEQDGEKTSLLRPRWLTNPEEYKPPPITFNGRRNFRGRREPGTGNPNNIRVSNDWKNKAPETTSEAGESSLLKPSWLTNPQPVKPAANFNNRSRGNFRRFRKY